MNYTLSDLVNATREISKSFFNKKQEYELTFNHESDGYWYIDFPNWKFNHHNLMMVAGADDLCEFLSSDNISITLNVVPSKKELELDGYYKLEQKDCSLTGGSTYSVTNINGFEKDIWLCPVTLFVFGEYPKYLYIKPQR